MRKRRPMDPMLSRSTLRIRLRDEDGPGDEFAGRHYWTIRSGHMWAKTRPRGQPVQRHRRLPRPSGQPNWSRWVVPARPVFGGRP